MYENGHPLCLQCDDDRRKAAAGLSDKSKVHAALVQALAKATLQAELASTELNRVIADVPSGLPTPDGTQRIQNAGSALSAARKEVARAHGRINDYLSRGIVPEDLKRSG